MPIRTGEAEWSGNLKNGTGHIGQGDKRVPYSFVSRFNEGGTGGNPEELIANAHAACFSMALSHLLSQNNFLPNRVHTKAHVHVDKVGNGFEITQIDLCTEGTVPGIDLEKFRGLAEQAKKECPVSKALAGVKNITLNAQLATAATAAK